MNNYAKRLILIIFLLLSVSPLAARDNKKRVALVIGNSSYRTTLYLKKPVRDALNVKLALTDLGFDVVFGIDQTKEQIEQLIRLYGEKLKGRNVVSFFYYSGVGFHSAGDDYLAPVDVDMKTEAEAVKTSVLLKTVFQENFAHESKSNIVLLDPVIRQPPGWFYATKDLPANRNGFTINPAPANTVVLLSSGLEKTVFEKCDNYTNFVVEALLKRLAGPKTELKKLLDLVGKDVEIDSEGNQKTFVVGYLKKSIYLNNGKKIIKIPDPDSLIYLVDKFRTQLKCNCGERNNAVLTGKKIIEKYAADQENKSVVEAVQKRIRAIEKEDPVCRDNSAYDRAYKTKNWPELFSVGRRIIEREGEKGIGFDVLLDLVSVGFNRMEIDKNYKFQNETLDYAQQGLKLLDAGVKTNRFGVFEPFLASDSARCWLNYTIGIIYERRLDRRLDGLQYYYRAMLYGPEKRDDPTILIKLGDYYVEQATKLIEANRKRDAGDQKADLDYRTGLAYADRGLDAFGRGLRAMRKKNAPPKTIEQFNSKLQSIYRLRFNLSADANFEEVLQYVDKLIAGPLPDPGAKVEPAVK
ncbi:MAG: caspase family protein [Acidobacteria bacterium]|nr:caspase family protein [Acidobacteriota bacterium]